MRRLIYPLLGAVVAAGCAGRPPLPPQALLLNEKGAEALAAGDLATADARLSLALEYSAQFVEALVNLALVECQRGNFTRSRQLLLRARRLNPDVSQPHHGLGVLAERERRPDRASEHYRDALRVDPGFAPARANLGRLEFDAGQLDLAYLTFKKLVESAPDNPEGLVGLAETLIRQRRFEEARAVIRTASERFDSVPAVTLLDARNALRDGNADRAIARLMSLTERGDEFAAEAFAWIAVAELSMARSRRAVGAAERALSLDPEQPVATHALAAALEALGDPSAAAWAQRSRALTLR